MSDALAELQTTLGEDHDNIKILACMLKASADMYEIYKSKGISDEIYFATMKCYTDYIGSGIFDNIIIISPTIKQEFAVFNIKAFHQQSHQGITRVATTKPLAYPRAVKNSIQKITFLNLLLVNMLNGSRNDDLIR